MLRYKYFGIFSMFSKCCIYKQTKFLPYFDIKYNMLHDFITNYNVYAENN